MGHRGHHIWNSFLRRGMCVAFRFFDENLRCGQSLYRWGFLLYAVYALDGDDGLQGESLDPQKQEQWADRIVLGFYH